MIRPLASVPLFLALAASASAQPVEWPTAEGGNGHFYEWVHDDLSWPDARLAATTMTILTPGGELWPGHLATTPSAEEWTFLRSLLGTDRVWIGLFQEGTSDEPAGNWFWVTGEPLSFSAWGPNEPNDANGGGGEQFCEVVNLWWNDLAEHGTPMAGYIVEFENEGSVSTRNSSLGAVKAMYGHD